MGRPKKLRVTPEDLEDFDDDYEDDGDFDDGDFDDEDDDQDFDDEDEDEDEDDYDDYDDEDGDDLDDSDYDDEDEDEDDDEDEEDNRKQRKVDKINKKSAPIINQAPKTLDPLITVGVTEHLNANMKQNGKRNSLMFTCVQLFMHAIEMHPSETTDKDELDKAASIISGNLNAINIIAIPKIIDAITVLAAQDISFVARLKRKKDGTPVVKSNGKPVYERNPFGKAIEKSAKGSYLASDYILAGFNRIEGFKVNTNTATTLEELNNALSQLDINAKAQYKLKNLQDCHTRSAENLSSETQEYLKQINDISKEHAKYYSEMTDEERKIREEEARNQNDVSRANEIDSVDEGLFEDYTSNIKLCPEHNSLIIIAGRIMKVYDSLFESCIALGRIFGALEVSKQTGKPAVIRPYSENGKITFSSSKDVQSNNSMIVRDWFHRSMMMGRQFPTLNGGLICGSNKQVPSVKNIEAGINYYPYFILQYAMGFVPDKKQKRLVRHYKWGTFRKALEDDVKSRLYKIYEDGGAEYFSNPMKRDKLIEAFTTSALVLTGDKSLLNYQVRCSANRPFEIACKGDLNTLVRNLYGTEVSIHPIEIKGYTGSLIVDIQGYGSKAEFLGRPNWAYKALGRIYGGGDVKPNLKDGIPIGLTTRGDIVKMQMGHDNNKLVIGLYAGSRSGKGVQTLATLCAAYGGGAGVCYVDRKPDMATIFWKIERDSTSGLHTYAMDVTDDRDRLDGNGKPHRATAYLENEGHSEMVRSVSPLLYMKHLQVMSLVAQARKEMIDSGKRQDMLMWVLDEVTISTTEMSTVFGKKKPSRPTLKAKATDEDKVDYEKSLYEYQWLEFRDKINEAVSKDINATWGQVRYTILMIGQNPSNQMEGEGANTPLGKLFKAMDSMLNCYIAGRGLQGVYSYGTIALKTKDPAMAELVENNRFFEIRYKSKVNKDEGKGDTVYKSEVFQPFFCVNTSDVLDPCWTGGIASTYGYDPNAEDGEKAMLDRYYRNLHTELGDPENEKAIVHRGTGFYGLLDTYMAYIKDPGERRAASDAALGKGYKMVEEALTYLGILGEGNPFGYTSVEDFVYDLDPEKNFTTRNELETYIHTHEMSGNNGDDGEEGSDPEDLDFGVGSNSDESEESENNTEPEANDSDYEEENAGEDYREPDGESYDREYDQNGENDDYTEEQEMGNTESEVYGQSTQRPNQEEPVRDRDRDSERDLEDRIRRLRYDSSNIPHYGAVRATTSNYRQHRIDDEGMSTVDQNAYRMYLNAELQDIDNKFLYANSFLSKYGSAKHYKQRQKAIINTIKQLPRTMTCERVYIGYDDITVNGCSFGRAQGYGEGYVNILEGFSFPRFFKQFSGIKALALDEEACKLLHEDNQLGYGGLEVVFQMEPKLQKIEYPDMTTGKTNILTRQATSRVKYVRAEEKRYREQEEAEKVLEDSFLFGGPLSGEGRNVLKANERNRSRARKAASDIRTNPKSRARSSRLVNRSLGKAAIGVALGAGSLALVPIKAIFSAVRGVRAGVEGGF